MILILLLSRVFAQQPVVANNINQLNTYQDSLKKLGNEFVHNQNDLERKNANYAFIKTLVTALKTNNSFTYPFDSLKTISLTQSPDNKFRIFSWHVANNDGSYRFYGAIQMNTSGPLKLYGLEDYSPLIKNPEDTVADNRTWFGAQYYTIVPVMSIKPYYVLLGWKGYTDKSTKRVIDVLSFKDDKPVFGMPIFEGNNKKRSRVVFQYARQASMLLKHVPAQNLIVFDNLAPPDKRNKDQPETYGPDLTYNGYQLKNGKWTYVDNIDMRNIPNEMDEGYVDPRVQQQQTRPIKAEPARQKRVQ
ncbi:hypothetical protein [Mucilaginibacter antarcticus]|uniref:GLPGLI family protein n=1 Tax=Mucilaginibacter antarcticus TaxID=1855725 RepID=A0ABW5XNY3_9SPHI